MRSAAVGAAFMPSSCRVVEWPTRAAGSSKAKGDRSSLSRTYRLDGGTRRVPFATGISASCDTSFACLGFSPCKNAFSYYIDLERAPHIVRFQACKGAWHAPQTESAALLGESQRKPSPRSADNNKISNNLLAPSPTCAEM